MAPVAKRGRQLVGKARFGAGQGPGPPVPVRGNAPRRAPVTVESDEQAAECLERRGGFILGVYLKALSVSPLAVIHELDPADAPHVPICLVTLDGAERPEVSRMRQIFLKERGLLRRLLGSGSELAD